MKNRIRIFCCLLVLNVFTISFSHGQELTGIWRGHFRDNKPDRLAGINDDRYRMEVQIAQTNHRFEAVTYSYKNTEFYGKAEASGSLNPETKKVLLKEGKLLEVHSISGGACIMTCFFQYSRLGNDEYLQGTFYSTNAEDTTINCGKGSIFLHRVLESDFYKEPFLEKKEKELLAKKEESVAPKVSTKPVTSPKPATVAKNTAPKTTAPAKSTAVAKNNVPKNPPAKKPSSQPKVSRAEVKTSQPQAEKKSTDVAMVPGQTSRDSAVKIGHLEMPVSIPLVLKTRKNELLKTITVNHNQIELRIYDDGAIDNDTVSIYYDNKLIISRARLTDQAITIKINVEPSEHPHQLVMVAENLGEIPPNTSLMVVTDGEKRYEERIISTEQKNVEINFMYKKLE